jgi:predicted alternative tryptophan synthase beta-subunit
MKRHITIVTATAMFLLAAISFNSLAAYAQGGANMTGMAAQKSTTIHVVPEHESAQQIRDETNPNHPLLAAIADKIQTMDERETLKYTLGVEIVADLLKMHAAELIINRTAGSQSIMP